jgi:hypothetical protein
VDVIVTLRGGSGGKESWKAKKDQSLFSHPELKRSINN